MGGGGGDICYFVRSIYSFCLSLSLAFFFVIIHICIYLRYCVLTHLSQMGLPTLISRTSPISNLGVLDGFFHFFQILIELSARKQ